MLIFILISIALLVAAVVFSLFVGWKVSSLLLHPNIYPYDTVVDEEVKRGHFTREWFDAQVHLDEFYLHSPFGYELHCALWPRKGGAAFPDGRRRVAVLVHGFTYCLLGGIKYASIFHELGFDCVLYDHRNHGLSGRAPTTMGICESLDLAAVCSWARERFGEDAVLGTHGESMGAATVMLHAATDERLAFAMEDCGYSSFLKEMKVVLRVRFHLPVYPILPIASLLCKLRGGAFLGRILPAAALSNAGQIPMLFLHGDMDGLVPFAMLKENYDAKPGAKAMLPFPGAKHADCYRTNPEQYRAGMEAFLRENGLL
ncbi:MAG: alpha/beta hydrolase [Christensenella sp.]|nr:alpha/beta hydrolase [Christensenella sp.]